MAQELVQLQPGTQVERWTIEKKLAEGGFGAVYKVSDSTGQYALKVVGIYEQNLSLRAEVLILSTLTEKRHICEVLKKFRLDNYLYVVTTLVGKSLQDLRKEGPGQHMSMGTAISSGIQCLEALEDLHGIGYLHRNVKPSNYTIGRVELNEQRKVYIHGFGMCRKFTNEQGKIRKPRASAVFCGTVRYAPISCHMERELCRKDDLESWVYMIVELTTGNLPWKNVQDMNAVGDYKCRCRSEPFMKELFGGCPREYMKVLQYVDGLKYCDAPNYQMCYQLMRKALTSMNAQEFPYDWEKAGGDKKCDKKKDEKKGDEKKKPEDDKKKDEDKKDGDKKKE